MTEATITSWQPIESAPKDTEILIYTKPWGPIIALHNEEFGEWLSRMQVPVSIKEDGELPTHWQPLPEPPAGTDSAHAEDGSPAGSPPDETPSGPRAEASASRAAGT